MLQGKSGFDPNSEGSEAAASALANFLSVLIAVARFIFERSWLSSNHA